MVYIGIAFCFLLNMILGMIFYKFMLSGSGGNSIDVGYNDGDITEVSLKALADRAYLASKNPSLTVRALENRQIISSLTDIGENQEQELQRVRLEAQNKRINKINLLRIVN